jgi:hypothetical protein
LLNVVSQRKDSETLLKLFLEQGVSGASISNWRFADANSAQTQGGLRINREFGCITIVTPQPKVAHLLDVFRERVTTDEMKSTCCFTHRVPMVKTFATIS